MKRFLTLQVSGGIDSSSALSQLRKSLAERREPDETALEAGLRILLTSDLRDKLKYIRQPVLLLHGENDVITHPDAAKWMNGQLQESELILLSRCGHAPFLSHPDEFIKSMVRLHGGVLGNL
jgi:pimeloyl-[acyl-carrier protein] methyl ester esterase